MEFKSSLNSNINQTHTILLSLLVVFHLILILGFLMVYLPWVKLLRDEVNEKIFFYNKPFYLVCKNLGINRNYAEISG